MAPESKPPVQLIDRLPLIAKLGLGIGLLVIVSGLYWVVFYAELSANLESATNQGALLRDQVQQLEAAQVEYQKDLDEKARKELMAREQKKMLPDESETPSFLSSLQAAATVSGVALQAWDPIEEAVQDYYVKIPMKLKIVGRFHNVVKFFQTVGQLPRIMNIENIAIKVPKADGPEVLTEMECLATAFRASRATDEGKRKGRKGGAQR